MSTTLFSRRCRLAVLSLTAVVSGCATVIQPQQAVNNLDSRGQKYGTQECQQARQTALNYDDNVSGRMGIGLGLGLLLGPFGLPFAIAADVSQKEKRDAVLLELERHCESSGVSDARPSSEDVEARIQMLTELHKKGLLTDAEYSAKKSQTVDGLLNTRTSAQSASISVMDMGGAQFRFRDMDPLSRSSSGDLLVTVDSSSSAGISLNGGAIVLDGSGKITRGSLPPPYIQGTASKQLQEGASVKAKFVHTSGQAAVDATVRIRSAEVIIAGSKQVRVLRSNVSGFLPGGSPFDGEVLLEPNTGLILRADIKASTRPFILRDLSK